MPSRPSGATTPSVMPAPEGTRLTCEWLIAPGWNAVIWLSSRSVVMNACAVYSSAISRTCVRSTERSRSHSPYGAKSWPTVAIGAPVPPSSARL